MRLLKLLAAVAIMAAGRPCHSQNPPVTPAWAFGHIVWEDSLNTSRAVTSLVGEYLRRDIPVSGVIIDSPWSDSYNDFNWDRQKYPDHAAMISHLKSCNVKVILWLTGALNTSARDTRIQKSANFDYALSRGFAINGGRESKWWKGTGIHVDFTDRKAKRWWSGQLDKVFVDGVYGWKVDQAEYMFGDTVSTSAGSMRNEDFRPYYYDAMYDYTLRRNPAGVTLARPYSHQGKGFFAGVGKMNLGWCGDFTGDWKGISLQVDNMYRSAQKGYGAIACEVGGFFRERSDKEQFVRYAQFGAMTAGMVNGGENGALTNHLPWYHGPEVVDIYRFCVVLHDQLIPYLFSSVVDAHLNGGSLMKNLSFEQESHTLGNDLFTKVISEPGGRACYVLPAGAWVDFWTGAEHAGGSSVNHTYPLDRFPLYFRKGAIIPLRISNALTGIGDATLRDKEVFLIYAGELRSDLLYHRPLGEGMAYDDIAVAYDGIAGRLSLRGKKNEPCVFLLRNIDGVSDVEGADAWHYDPARRELRVSALGKRIEISIRR